jgi:hypothetical protein
MGYVLPRDFLSILEGTFPSGQMARELCHNKLCNDKWLLFLEEEVKVTENS